MILPYYSIHLNTAISFISAAITLAFAVYHLFYYLVISSDRMVLALSGFLTTLFLYLLGYSMYSSGTDVGWVLFWTRICYSGGAATVFSCYIVAREIAGWESRFFDWLFRIAAVVLVGIIFLPWEGLFIPEFLPDGETSTVLKGPYFIPFLMVIFLFCGVILVRFIIVIIPNKKKRHQIMPLIIGFSYWFLETIFNGIFAAVLHNAPTVMTFGSIVMALCLAIYNAGVAEERHEELIRVRRENDEMQHDLMSDSLSGLFTRMYFIRRIQERIAYLSRNISKDFIFFIDIDHFKSVNDELGHHVGDTLIQEVGSVLKSHMRKTDVSARFGGDEFLVLLADGTKEKSLKIAQDIMDDFRGRLPALLGNWEGSESVSMSIGVLGSEFWSDDPVECIRRADHAMYVSKRTGRNRISEFYPNMD